jgi:hypothetical protein
MILTKLETKYINFKDDLVGWFSFKDRIDFKWSWKIISNAIIHDYKLTLRRTDLQCFVRQKFIVLDRLMKIAIIQNDTSRGIGLSQSQLITKNQFKHRIASKIALHLYAAVDWRVDDVSWRIEKDVNFLVNVYKNLVCTVFANRNRWSWRVDSTWTKKIVADFFQIYHARFTLYDLTCNQWFYMGCVSQLRMSEIDDLVQDFID